MMTPRETSPIQPHDFASACRALIQQQRLRRKLTVREAAALCDMTPSRYSHKESGHSKISLEDLKQIADGLGVPPRSLIAKE